MQRPPRLRITEVSPHLICALCGGYLIDATTIVECLHSFCKTCIVRYLEASKYCPICEVLVHKTRPLQNIRLDHTLQDIVYKLVPGLFKDEMQRRREFYKNSPTIRKKHGSDDKSSQTSQRIIYSADEMFSVSLELCPDGLVKQKQTEQDSLSEKLSDRRYLLCPAGVTVSHLRKFIHVKFCLTDFYQVEVFHKQGNLRDSYSLMDVAYIYSWRRDGVLKLYYSIYKKPAEIQPIPAVQVTPTENSTPAIKEEEQKSVSLPNTSSLLSTQCCKDNLPHDLSPLELIATVANDLSCLEEGRGLKRKSEAAELCYENDEDSASEIQIKKSIEHAIDLCSNGNQEKSENSSQKEEKKVSGSDCKANTTSAGGEQSNSQTNVTTNQGNHTSGASSSESNKESHSKPPAKCQKMSSDHTVPSNHVQDSNSDIKSDTSHTSVNNNAADPHSSSSKSGSEITRDKSHDSRTANQKSECLSVSQMNGFCKPTDADVSTPSKVTKSGQT